MASPPSRTTPVDWSVQQLALGTKQVPSGRLRITLYFRNLSGKRTTPHRCWLDTGAPLCVVPFRIHQRLAWQPLGVKGTYAGQPCDLGSINVWFPTDQPFLICGPLSVVAKFPHRDPPGGPTPILLGLEFFLSHHASLALPWPPNRGHIYIP
jgi:hypothetical protein